MEIMSRVICAFVVLFQAWHGLFMGIISDTWKHTIQASQVNWLLAIFEQFKYLV